MSFGGDPLPASEADLLARAAQWPDHAALESLTAETLRQITRREGVDFATALLFDRFQKSPERVTFIHRINALRQAVPSGPAKVYAKIVIVPGALYLERPDMGGDGRVIREVAADFGLQTDLIPLSSFGSVTTNAALIRTWLGQHSQERIILVSLSKGGADLKLALPAPDAPEIFRDVIAWINVCGPLSGSRMADWILESRLRTWFFRWKLRWQRRDFQFVTDMRRDGNGLLASPLRLPPTLKLVTLIGFPLHRHMTTRFSRFCHRILAPAGPNDGTTSLADLQAVPGDIYPAWGMDHYFRPENKAKKLVAAVLQYLAETGSAPKSFPP
jgi:hypothetical protein